MALEAQLDIKVSIIVPVYNSSKHVARCLDSVLNQGHKKMEIIIINDGSSDDSEEIIKKYCDRDKRIKYIYQENKGLSGARNTGIENSEGEYLMFLDSDDYIEENTVEVMLKKSLKDKLDITICLIKYVIYSGEERNSNRYLSEDIVENNVECLKRMLLAKDIRFHAVNKLFKAELFNQIRFPIGKLFEDTGTIYKVVMKSDRIGYVNKKLYNYVFNTDGSITNSKFNDKKFDLLFFAKEIEDYLIQKKLYDECYEYIEVFKIDSYLSIITYIYKTLNLEEANQKKKIVDNNFDKSTFKKVLINSKISKKNKIKYIISSYFPGMYKTILKLGER